MDNQQRVATQRWRRRHRVRSVASIAVRPRLTVFRSNKHIYAQVIDDNDGRTLASASTQQKSLVDGLKSTSDCEAAKRIGKAIADRAKAAGIESVWFDRGHYRYHGRVAALADAAREGGLKF